MQAFCTSASVRQDVETKINSSSGRRAKKTKTNSNSVRKEKSENSAETAVNPDYTEAAPDITGAELDGGFRVIQRLGFSSGEADIYECSRNSGESMLLKYYRRTDAIKDSVLGKLRDMQSPYVPPVYAAGVYQGHQYVIMPRYQKRSLADELDSGITFTLQDLKSRIIPSVNEALKVIHEAGIIHKDLKPANLIPDDTGAHIVLIDFGISSYAGKKSIVLTQPGMTPGYAAPEVSQGIFLRETDYYALGITVFELFTGYTPFQNSGLSDEELVRLAVVNKISFPDNFPEELQDLVLGLTFKDISRRNEPDNPSRRWGYDEVRRWLNGEDVPVPDKPVSKPAPVPPSFPPYKFNGRIYTDSETFIRALLASPEEGIRELGRGIISHHYGLYDETRAAMARLAEKEMEHSPEREYGILCSLMYRLDPSLKDLYAGGRPYQSMEDLARELLKAVTQAKDSRLIRHAVSLLRAEFFAYYAREIVKNQASEEILARIKRLMGERAFSETELACLLGWFFSRERSFRAGNRVFQSPEDFREKMALLREQNPMEYHNYIVFAEQELRFVSDFIQDPNARSYIEQALNTKTVPPVPHVLPGSDEMEPKNETPKTPVNGCFSFWGPIAAVVFIIAGVFWKLLSAGSAPAVPEIIELTPEQCLSRGFVLEQQHEKALALKYFEDACQSDVVSGCVKAGWYYQNGIGIPEADYLRAREFYEISCNLNDGMGCSGLGWLYQQGQGGSRDYDKAREYYQKGCRLDNGNGCTGLGNLYRYGLGVSKDPAESRRFFEKACQLGHHKGCTAIQE